MKDLLGEEINDEEMQKKEEQARINVASVKKLVKVVSSLEKAEKEFPSLLSSAGDQDSVIFAFLKDIREKARNIIGMIDSFERDAEVNGMLDDQPAESAEDEEDIEE